MIEPPSESRLRSELEAYYGPLLPHWDRTLAGRGDMAFWRGVVEARTGARVLEIGAGSGRVTEVLAPAARRVVALDLVPAALRRARERLCGAENVDAVVADMRTFRLDARFDLVVAANDPFSHLRTDPGRRKALERVAEHLAPDGRFVLDALWFTDAWLEEAAGPGGRCWESPVPDGDEVGGADVRVRQRWRCRREARVCEARYELLEGDRRVAASTFRGRYWTREEIDERFGGAGLVVERCWGDYERSAWTPSSEHLVVSAAPA